MKIKHILLTIFLVAVAQSCKNLDEGKHLFILSGQSNMSLLDPEISFIPHMKNKFGEDKVIFVKSAYGGQPIMRWYKNWKYEDKVSPTGADLYDSLINKTQKAILNEKLASISFFWMQGERDSWGYGSVYKESLMGIHRQLKNDLGREDINFVIGRLSDFGNDIEKMKRPDWMMIREIQVNLALSDPRIEWIDTDDLNDGINNKGKTIKNDLHMSVEGYRIMGERFAQKGEALINKHMNN
tara:strand:+ start:4921 stop:5640 length:720 start_codon:yes stop_codon:yes gene_type:complete